jgi:hypothetical protein
MIIFFLVLFSRDKTCQIELSEDCSSRGTSSLSCPRWKMANQVKRRRMLFQRQSKRRGKERKSNK